MNGFDAWILAGLNRLSRSSYALDLAVTEAATSHLVKGVPLVALLLGFWFARDARRNREVILSTLAASAAALLAGRLLAHLLPFRDRPIHDPSFAFVPPFGPAAELLRGWSAFPSDHAMLFGALATGVLLLSTRLGILAHAWALLAIGLPRLYLGWHHPTDVLAGALLGAAFVVAASAPRVRRALAAPPLRWLEAHPPSFYAAAFLVTVQLATMFSDARKAGGALLALREGAPGAASPGAPAPREPSIPAREATAAAPRAVTPPVVHLPAALRPTLVPVQRVPAEDGAAPLPAVADFR